MNFSPFGNHFPPSIPTIHQFAAKFSHEVNTNGVGTQTSISNDEALVSSTNRFPNHFQNQQVLSGKYQRDSSTQLSSGMLPSPSSNKFASDVHQYSNMIYNSHPSRQEDQKRSSNYENSSLSQQQQAQQEICNLVKREEKAENGEYHGSMQPQPGMPPSWQSIAAPGSTVADYLSHLPASTLPISLHHFLKYSAESIKKDLEPDHAHSSLPPSIQDLKKKKKKKIPKEKKPRPKPGEIRLTTALDGSTLYCCPECHMAYPDKALLEQHLLGHTMERRFFCDICGAGLKRKDHLTRHKQSHNPERPFVCTVCMKAFKRKEQLTLHFVIHSGEKRHVCSECGKGFYRKDHLRKHTKSHIARRVKAEISQHVPTNGHTHSERDTLS